MRSMRAAVLKLVLRNGDTAHLALLEDLPLSIEQDLRVGPQDIVMHRLVAMMQRDETWIEPPKGGLTIPLSN